MRFARAPAWWAREYLVERHVLGRRRAFGRNRPPDNWRSRRVRRSRKSLGVARRLEGSNPSPSANKRSAARGAPLLGCVFTSDNGVAWGEHPLIASRKVVPYEEPIRVPLVIRYDPLVHERPSEDGHLVLNIDLASTFAAVAGTRMPGAEGRSLLPLLAPVPRPRWRHDFLIEHLAGPPQREVPSYCAVRGERYKYVLYQTREEELYDLLRDPHELDNIAPHPAVRA